MAGKIKHRHQTAIPAGGADVDANEWNDSLVASEGTDGQYMQRDSAQADGWKWGTVTIPAFDWTTIFKTGDENRASNIVSAADSVLVVPVLASKLYLINFKVYFTSGTTPDIKYEITGPASPTRITMRTQSLPPNSTTMSDAILEAYVGSTTTVACTTNHDGYLAFEIILSNGVNAGNVSFAWAQNTSDPTAATVYAGSWVEYRQLN